MTIHHRELEESIASLAPVASVRVAGDGPSIDRVHVITATDASPETLVDDVRALAWSRFGVIIDRPTVSVTRIVRSAT